MSTDSISIPSQRQNLLVAFAASFGITSLWFLMTWRYGFDLADEGFYWYGAQRTLLGEVPIRDFHSYDIGRYYWTAGIMGLMGSDGIYVARIAAAAYQAVGTFVGVYICLLQMHQKEAFRWIYSVLAASLLTIWVLPYYKVYDHSTSIIIVGVLFIILKFSKPIVWLAAGICLGLATVMGRNHGVYGGVAVALVLLVMLFKAPVRRDVVHLIGYFVIGMIVGYVPNLIMMMVVEEFFDSFVDGIIMLFKYRSTNISLPVPWPWGNSFSEFGIVFTLLKGLIGSGFIFLIIFPVFGILYVLSRKIHLKDDARLVFLAAIAASIPYAHYAFSRADVIHLTLSIFPSLIGLLVLGSLMKGIRSVAFCALMLTLSVATLSTVQPYLTNAIFQTPLVKVNVGGEEIKMLRYVSKRLEWADKVLSTQQRDSGGRFLALPDMPGLYAIHHSKMPLWEIYSLIPRPPEFEKREIARLKLFDPDVVLLSDHALDGREEFRYSRTHPLTYEWIALRYKMLHLNDDSKEADTKAYVRQLQSHKFSTQQ